MQVLRTIKIKRGDVVYAVFTMEESSDNSFIATKWLVGLDYEQDREVVSCETYDGAYGEMLLMALIYSLGRGGLAMEEVG